MFTMLVALTITAPEVPIRIDAEIAKSLQSAKITPAGRATDEELVRRLYLDLIGRVPTVAETLAFLDEKTSGKIDALIDQLLKHPEFAMNWAQVFDLWLNARPENSFGQREFVEYLRQSFSENKPWDRIARELLLPNADDPKIQPAAYFLAHRLRLPKEDQIDGMTVAVASNFFGVRLECCKCHDHPYVAAWKQENYYGFASFFGRTELMQYQGKSAISERADGVVSFVPVNGTKTDSRMMFLDGKVIDQPPLSKTESDNYIVPRKGPKPALPKFSARTELVKYAITSENPYFQRAIVNRIWKKLLGRGLVEPEDQIHAENPATHPELFAFLADDFAQNQFDLKRLIAGIVSSETYQRSSIGENDTQYGVATLKPLTPEQLLVSLTIATGYDAVIKSKSKLKTPGMLEVRLELEREFTLFTEKYESASPQFEATTSQALFMTYNQASQKYLKPFVGGLITELLKLSDNGSIVDRAYLAILSRRPSSDERQEMMRYLDLMKPQREARVRDLVWALLNSAEFRFNH